MQTYANQDCHIEVARRGRFDARTETGPSTWYRSGLCREATSSKCFIGASRCRLMQCQIATSNVHDAAELMLGQIQALQPGTEAGCERSSKCFNASQCRLTQCLIATLNVQEAAELIASRSCGEGWLVQPKIADMPEMEYRCVTNSPCSQRGRQNHLTSV